MKKLSFGLHQVKGRNKGRVSSFQRGGGHTKRYKFIDFSRTLPNISGKILKVDYDAYRSADVFLVGYTNGILSYTLGIDSLKVGDSVSIVRDTKETDLIKLGVSCPLKNVKVGIKVHNVENFPGSGGQIARSAGSCAILLKKYEDFGLLKLPSGEYRLLPLLSMCTIGTVGNVKHKDNKLLKAGVSRWLGRRPHVRGQAMNPVDHPHGGRTNGGKIPRTPWGKLAKGVKTGARKTKLRVRLRNV